MSSSRLSGRFIFIRISLAICKNITVKQFTWSDLNCLMWFNSSVKAMRDETHTRTHTQNTFQCQVLRIKIREPKEINIMLKYSDSRRQYVSSNLFLYLFMLLFGWIHSLCSNFVSENKIVPKFWLFWFSFWFGNVFDSRMPL